MKISDEFYCEIEDELNEMESLYQTLYRNHPERDLELPHAFEDVHDLLSQISKQLKNFPPEILTDSLLEEDFFPKNQDVSLYKHTRYMPATYHKHSFFEVACLLNGQCTNYILDQKLTMLPGDICIISPNTVHAISAFSDDCIMLNFLLRTSTFEKAFFGTLSETDILSDFFLRTLYHSKEHPYLYFRTAEDLEIRSYIGYAYQENIRNRRYKNRMMNSIINAFFISLLRNHEKDVIIPDTNGTKADENLIFILRYMQENYKTLTLKLLADFFNYSERQLQRIIKSYTGMNFSENIQKLKMNRAVDLLANKDLSIAEIAEEIGYSDVSNFRHFFKNYYNMTPIEFRTLNKKKEKETYNS